MPCAAAFFALWACCILVCTVPSEAQAEAEADDERRNAVALGFTHAFQILRADERGGGAASSEHLWGFVATYERVLMPRRLTLVIAKPFYFTRDRFDSPMDVLLKVFFPKGHWEPFVSVGISGNLRVFSGELEQERGGHFEYTFGVVAVTGFTYAFTPRWGLSLELGYSYFVNGLAQHEITDALSGVLFF